MDSIINHIKATTGTHLTHQDVVDLGRTVARVSINTQFTDADYDEFRERTNRVGNAYLAIWDDDTMGALPPATANEMIRVLGGGVNPDDANLPKPPVSAFHHSDEMEPDDELDEAIDELLDIVDCSERESDSPRAVNGTDERRVGVNEEAEELWTAFLDGEPLTTSDIRVLAWSQLV